MRAGVPEQFTRSEIRESAHAATLIAVLGMLSWATGQPGLFPSLGPSAYVLATQPAMHRTDAIRIVGGHVIGVVAGLVAYHSIASGLVVTVTHAPFSMPGLRLSASATLAVALTTAGMLVTDLRHAPACATTLIVGLGLLSTPLGGGIIVVAIAALVTVEAGLTRIG